PVRHPSTDPNRPPNGRCSTSDPLEPVCSSSKGKNPRKRSSRESDGEACAAPPPKKRASNRHSPSTSRPSPVAKHGPSRRSTRKVARSTKKEVPEPADPDTDVIVIDVDGYPYVAYDDAPHLHPPPRRYKQNESAQPSAFQEKVKGCSIKPCWTLTQQRRCRVLQADEAVEEIGWKKVRKWMQAVRCRLCGETQVLRDLTKGCFNLEHWWRHLRVRHGIKRDEELEDKGEEKYKTLPLKDHVCVGACSTCGEGGVDISRRLQNPGTSHPRRLAIEPSDLSSLSSIGTTPSLPQASIPETILTSTPRIEHHSSNHPLEAGPSNVNDPLPRSALYTLANARPQYRCESVATLTTFPISSCRDQPPLIPLSWAPYIDPSSDPSPLGHLPASHRPPTGNPSTSTPQLKSSRSTSSGYTIPTSRLSPVMIAPHGVRNRWDTVDTSVVIHHRSPTATVALSTAGTSTAPPTHTRSGFPSRSTSARPPTLSETVVSYTFTQSIPSDGSPQSPQTTAESVVAAPSLSSYRWPPADVVPVGAPSPPCMTAASWEENDTEDEADEVGARPMRELPKDVPAADASETEEGGGDEDNVMRHRHEMEASARLLHHFSVSAWEHHEMASAPKLISRPTGETAEATESEPSLCPGWAVIKQEESEPESDEDEDMIDQLLDDN
ncbi:hypothetical protein V8D89_009726, partial [Ganoderma adspersum]